MTVQSAITMSSSLAAVNSNGVHERVIEVVESRRERLERLNDDEQPHYHCWLELHEWHVEQVEQRDAQFTVECLQLLLQQERIAERATFCLYNHHISDAAMDVFCGFLRETSPCHLQSLGLASNLLPRQFRRLLEALHTNRSVKELHIHGLHDDVRSLMRIGLVASQERPDVPSTLFLSPSIFANPPFAPWTIKLENIGTGRLQRCWWCFVVQCSRVLTMY
jgi:hypothetical protein